LNTNPELVLDAQASKSCRIAVDVELILLKLWQHDSQTILAKKSAKISSKIYFGQLNLMKTDTLSASAAQEFWNRPRI
jgi:hypothetical protein